MFQIIFLATILTVTADTLRNEYETSVQKGPSSLPLPTKRYASIDSGDCEANYSQEDFCHNRQWPKALKVTVKDGQPFPEVKINNDFNAAYVVRQTDLSDQCDGQAEVVFDAYCSKF